jgi:predicted MFS family arabinose efflux permease
MAGNILSVALWVAATDFRTFLASRIVGGLSEGNIQLATSIAADISDEKSRGSTMALIGVCFSIAFTFGPALGAALSTVSTVAANPFATAAGFSLFLIVVETIYLYLYLPETLPSMSSSARPASRVNGASEKGKKPAPQIRTNSHFLLNFTHLAFILFFSGMEFSLTFMTYDLFSYGAGQSGRLLGFIGLCATILEGGVTRRLPALRMVQIGVISCAAAFFLLGRIRTEGMLYLAAALLAVTNATVVTGLKSLSSLEATEHDRGKLLGNHRSWGRPSLYDHFYRACMLTLATGQIGRASGPLIFCSLYWWAGRNVAYSVGGAGMLGVCMLVFGGLRSPSRL